MMFSEELLQVILDKVI